MSLNKNNCQNEINSLKEMVKDCYDGLSKREENSYQVDVIEKRDCKEFPVISQQLDIYIESITNNNTVLYNVPMTFNLNKDVNIERVKEGFNQVFEKHQILKSKYIEKEINGEIKIYGCINEDCKLVFEEYNYENASSFVRPFDLSSAPLIRVGFIGNEVLLIDMHHIISDGTTIKIIIDEINKYYNEGSISKLEIQFGDYAYYIDEKMKSGFYLDQVEFYKRMFNCEYEIFNIPNIIEMNKNNDNEKNAQINNITKDIDILVSKRISDFINGNNMSKTAFFLSIYGYVVSKYSGQEVVYTSIISTNRRNHYVKNMIGTFDSIQPILLKYEENDKHSFVEVIKENMSKLMSIHDNQDLSFSELSKMLKLKKVNNAFVYQPKSLLNNFSSPEFQVISNERLEVHEDNSSKFDITCNLIEKDNKYYISVNYNNKVYKYNTVNKLIDSFIEMAGNVEQFNDKICEIEYIPKEEKSRIIKQFNHDIFTNDCQKFYYVEFSKIAQQTPEKCAIVYNDIEISYGKLEIMSNSLANYLRSLGITRNDIVPVISERSYFYVIAILAISKAGGAFLPIDKKLPIDRIKFIIEEVHPKTILYYHTESIMDQLKDRNIKMYNLEEHNYDTNTEALVNMNEPNDTCYVLFTSGTTGKPKGALVDHFNIYNNLRKFDEKNECLGLYSLLMKNCDIQNILAITNFSFDISHNETIFSLIHGLRMVLVDDVLSNNISMLSDYILKNNVEFIDTTPTRFKLFMENEKFRNILKMIKAIVFIGEALPKSLCDEIRKYSNCKIINGYGPTECTVTCSYKEIHDDDVKITIGGPQCNYKLYVLDKYLKIVPIGVSGEIYISGYGVGKGYLNREELTNEKFIKCPFSDNEDNHYDQIMYGTGDLGNWLDNGEIDYIGRIDFQIKIHGQRIELGEIESIIKEIKDIEHAIVIDGVKENGDKCLISYFTSNQNIEIKDIRKYLKSKLPGYMIPNYFKKIYDIPTTLSGKLDRKALPKPTNDDLIKEEFIPPETEMEKQLCRIYSDILNINEEEVGKISDFYEMGGDSLNAIRLVSRFEKDLKVKLTILDIIEYPIICDLASHIEFLLNEDGNTHKAEEIKRLYKKEFPITSQQLGVYIDSIKNPNSIIYNVPVTFKLSKNVNIKKVKEAFESLFKNYEILRTKYCRKEISGKSEIYGIVDDNSSLIFEEYNEENYNSFIRPFNLSEAPLIRVGLVKFDMLMIDMHHIITDGASLSVIINYINNYYHDQVIDDIDIQFSDYAIYMNNKKDSGLYQKQIDNYKEMFNCDYEELIISNENQRKSEKINDNKKVGNLIKTIDESLSDSINKFVKQNEISKTAFFFSIYGYILSKYSGQNVVYSSVVMANRNNYYLENMIGMLVSTHPILLKYEENDKYSFTEIMKENMSLLMNMYSNQDLSLSELKSSLKLKRLSNTFAYQPKAIMETSTRLKNSIISDEDYIYELLSLKEDNSSKFDITFNLVEEENDYVIIVDYNNEKYSSELMERIINSYIEMIKNIDDFNKKLCEIEYIPEKEREMIINKFNDNRFEYPQDKLYHTEFSKLAKEIPEKCAIVCNGIEITYRKLDEMSNSLAHYLRNKGIGKGDIVPIISERSQYY
ncbi:hypothetical protein PIROE2DRAFT_6677, partial [Piromyces sp. E2]